MRTLLLRRSRRQYLQYKEEARCLVLDRLRYFNTHYRVPIGKVYIKNHASRWGSCSEKGNLNFNYKLVFLPPSIADYVIVHELCHLREFNHSPKFWALVAESMPEYKKLRMQLRTLERRK